MLASDFAGVDFAAGVARFVLAADFAGVADFAAGAGFAGVARFSTGA